MRGADSGMICERHLGMGSEDVDVALGGRGIGGEMQEDDFGEVEFEGYGLLLGLGEGFFGGWRHLHYSDWIAGVRRGREGVEGGEV